MTTDTPQPTEEKKAVPIIYGALGKVSSPSDEEYVCRLIGLTSPRSATLQPIATDSDTWWAKMPDDLWEKWWPFFKLSEENHWKKKWIATVKDGVVTNIEQDIKGICKP